MATMIARSPTTAVGLHPDLGRTARTTGFLYLGLALSGVIGTMLIRGQLYVADEPQSTLANLVEHATLARVGIAFELAIVLTQALTAVWFYRLFRDIDTFAAGTLAAFGMANAVAILGSAAVLATALSVSDEPSLAGNGGAAATVQLMYVLSGHLWGVAGVFFGLWLVPMGWLVVRSQWLPNALGQVLMVGGIGYVLSAFVDYLFSNADLSVGLLTVPATVGELWMISYLIVVGVRGHAASSQNGGGGHG